MGAVTTTSNSNTTLWTFLAAVDPTTAISFGGGNLTGSAYIIATGTGAQVAQSGYIHSFYGAAQFADTVYTAGSLSVGGNVIISGAVTSNINLSNNKALYGAETDGTYKNLIYKNSSNNVIVGSSTQTGHTNIYTAAANRVNIATGSDTRSYFDASGLNFANGYGVSLNGAWVLRYTSSAVYCDADSLPLRLVGSAITANPAITSDARLKTNITDMDAKYTTLLDVLDAKSYRYTNYRQIVTNCGFVAQDVLSALTVAGLTTQDFGGFVDVYGDGREYALDYAQFTPILWSVVKSLKAEVASLKHQLAALSA
ncbi:MAG: tail fiber domain-containing protein [Oscillospiraceae bacterium]